MTILIIAFGFLIGLAGLYLVADPRGLFGLMRTHSDALWLQISAVVVRLILGVLLISQASVSNYPVVIEALGWIAIVAAIILAAIGRGRFIRLMNWVLVTFTPYARVAGVVSLLFGGFLILAFV